MRLAIFDLDGVLADDRHRLPYALEHKWVDYFKPEHVLSDPVWPEGRLYLQLMQSLGWDIAYMTGRREILRSTTAQWLEDNGFPSGPLHMRGAQDYGRRLANYKVHRMSEISKFLGYATSDMVLFEDDPEVVKHVRATYGNGSARMCTWSVKEKAMIKMATA